MAFMATIEKSQHSRYENMTGSLQNGRTSRKMLSPTFDVVSLPENVCKIVRPFKPEFRARGTGRGCKLQYKFSV